MGKFDDKIQQALKELETYSMTYRREPQKFAVFQWNTGYAIMHESVFSKLKVSQKKFLLGHHSKGVK